MKCIPKYLPSLFLFYKNKKTVVSEVDWIRKEIECMIIFWVNSLQSFINSSLLSVPLNLTCTLDLAGGIFIFPEKPKNQFGES